MWSGEAQSKEVRLKVRSVVGEEAWSVSWGPPGQ